ncbi:hypothetical protein BGZ73_003816 [Actinomortierella ambigua]|nr:hypothetical protein BGZ73_003816 [Actinomortierella ambigua]
MSGQPHNISSTDEQETASQQPNMVVPISDGIKPPRKRVKGRKDSGVAAEENAVKALEIYQEQQQQGLPSLLNLPPELFSMILSFLYPSELTKLATLSKQVYTLVENQNIWKTIQTRNNLPEPKRKYPTTMVLVLAYSDLVCEQCLSLSEMKRGGQYSDRPLPVSLAWNPDHPIHLCLPCRQVYYMEHPVDSATETNGRKIRKVAVSVIYRLPDRELSSLTSEPHLPSRRDQDNLLFDEDEVRQRAFEYHGGEVGLVAERLGYVVPRHKKPHRSVKSSIVKPTSNVPGTAKPEMSLRDLVKATIQAPGEEGSCSSNPSGMIVRIGGDHYEKPIAGLPSEVWNTILARLYMRDLFTLTRVSKGFFTLVEELPIWKQIWATSQLPELKPRVARTYMAMVSRFGESICELCHCYSYPGRKHPADTPLPVLFTRTYSPDRHVWICLTCRRSMPRPRLEWGNSSNSRILTKADAADTYVLPRGELWDAVSCGRRPDGLVFFELDVFARALWYHGGEVGLAYAMLRCVPMPRHQRPKPKPTPGTD